MFSEIQISGKSCQLPIAPLPKLIGKDGDSPVAKRPVRWEWYECDFVLKQIVNSQAIYWSMAPILGFEMPGEPQQPVSIRMTVTTDREFDYSPLEGWVWHKTWIIPTIIVNVEFENCTSPNFQFPPNTYVSVMSVKPGSKSPENFYLVDVGLQGVDTLEAELGKHVFSGLKFTQTSYKHEGSKFNLVIALIHRQQGQIHPTVIDCKISPPIFIDSRKSARDEVQAKQSRSSEIFHPDMFDKQLIKRRKEQQEQITNDSQGFINYFTAPNIRNKIKNPFFLAFKFSNFVSLYYNSVRIPDIKNLVPDALEKMINAPPSRGRTSIRKFQSSIDKVNPDAYLSIVLKNTTNKSCKEIIQKFGHFDSGFLNILCDSSLIPKKFILIEKPSIVKQLYIDYYERVQKDYLQKDKLPEEYPLKKQKPRASEPVPVDLSKQRISVAMPAHPCPSFQLACPGFQVPFFQKRLPPPPSMHFPDPTTALFQQYLSNLYFGNPF